MKVIFITKREEITDFMLFKKASFYLAILGIVGTVLLVKELRKMPPAPPPLSEPTRSPYANSVAGTGIIEASRENVKLGAPKGGLIQKIFVQVGSRVKRDDPILQLDDRETRAQLLTMQTQLEAMRASWESEKVLMADAEDQSKRTQVLADQNVASVDERVRKDFALQSMRARVAKIAADIKAAEAQVETGPDQPRGFDHPRAAGWNHPPGKRARGGIRRDHAHRPAHDSGRNGSFANPRGCG